MDAGKRVHYGHQDVHGFSEAKAAAPHGNIAVKIRAFDIFHYDIGGFVQLKAVPDLDDGRDVFQPGKGLRFPQEPGFAGKISFRQRTCVAVDPVAPGGISGYQGGRVVFLDSDRFFLLHIPAQIGDAETALAQNLANEIFFLQQRPGTELMGLILPAGRIPALGAESRTWGGGHAAVAAFFVHKRPLYASR